MQFSRREFVGGGLMAAAGMTMPGCISLQEPLNATAPVPILRKAGFRKPGDKIRMAFIGSGGRGGANLNEFLNLGEEIVALCDVDRRILDGAAKRVAKHYPNVHRYQDWREMLDREKSLDAVVVSTPDHMHAACAIAAMERGCHVYVEKPLVRTWWEAERFREVAKTCGVVTQMGNNGNGMDGQRRNIEILHLAWRRAEASVQEGRVPRVQVARLVRFWHGRDGRHRVPRDELLLARTRPARRGERGDGEDHADVCRDISEGDDSEDRGDERTPGEARGDLLVRR